MMRARGTIGVGVAIAVLCLGFAGGAQEVPKRPAMAAPSAAGSGDPALRKIELTLNRAQVITLPSRVRNIVIGNPAIADVELPKEVEGGAGQRAQVFIRPAAVGSTNVFFIGDDGNIIEQMEINVVFDNANIQAALERLLPDENINVSVYRDSVFLSGKVHSAGAASNAVNIAQRFVADGANVINMMTVVGGQQVYLQVRVAEMSRDIRKNLSVEGSFSKQLDFRIGNNRSLPVANRLQFQTNAPTPTITAFAAGTLFTGTNVFGSPSFEVLERQNLVKTLAEPTLTAISGGTASFLSGGEFPFPAGLDENGQTIFEFREFGIRLNFTPVVVDKGRINLQISTEISALGDVVNGQQSLTQNRTETTVEIPSGGSLMISGLLQDDLSDTVSGFPYLKDVPVLGALFRSSEFQQQKTELVITVTAYLVKAVDEAAALALPTDGFEPASDVDIYLLGRMQKRYGDAADKSLWDEILEGPFGYMMK